MPGEQKTLFDLNSLSQPKRVLDGVVVREIRCKSLINRSGISDYSFNCYQGCTHGCGYCYARYMQKFHPHTEPWGKFVDVRINAVEVLTRQLRRLQPGHVFASSACDGWQPIERQYQLTRECCRLLLRAGFAISVLTKNDLVLRDLDVLAGHNASVGVTVTTPDETWAGIWEPGAVTVARRMEVLRQAKAAGLRTSIMFGPLLPGISDTSAALEQLFAMAAGLRVDQIWTDALNARSLVWPGVHDILRRHAPDAYEQYRQVLFDASYRGRYKKGLNSRIRQAAAASGMSDKLRGC